MLSAVLRVVVDNTRNIHANIARNAKARWIISLPRLAAAGWEAFKKFFAEIGGFWVLCLRTATFGLNILGRMTKMITYARN
jgi:hypothetical protein